MTVNEGVQVSRLPWTNQLQAKMRVCVKSNNGNMSEWKWENKSLSSILQSEKVQLEKSARVDWMSPDMIEQSILFHFITVPSIDKIFSVYFSSPYQRDRESRLIEVNLFSVYLATNNC